jgi:hypothetical protein
VRNFLLMDMSEVILSSTPRELKGDQEHAQYKRLGLQYYLLTDIGISFLGGD